MVSEPSFFWGEVEVWIVLIPPVWPLFCPFTSKFISSNATRSHQRGYNYNYNLKYNSKQPYRTTTVGDQSPGFPPALVTTTISISSAKDATTLTAADAESRISDERTPHDMLHDKNAQSWVEMKQMRDHHLHDWILVT